MCHVLSTTNLIPQDGITALHKASMQGHASVLGMLLAAGADSEARDTVRAFTEKCFQFKTSMQ
jgi:ankyrin repeat protein